MSAPAPTREILEAALAWWKRGETPIPIARGTKKPPRGFALKALLDGRRPSEQEIRSWWTRWPDAQVALVLGRTIVAVDTDGAGAERIIQDLNLPRTPTQRTPRPGRHRLFRVDAPTRGRVLKAPDGSSLELRGLGQYVLVAPSLHPSGSRYAWDVPMTEAFAPMPVAVLALFSDNQSNYYGMNRAARSDPPELPERWLHLVEKNPRTRAAWEGRGGHPDHSGSGKDMYLAHELRRCSFAPEEARRILRAAPYPVEGGRTEKYLDLTLGKAYQAGRKRELPAYGAIPAALVDDGTFARLSLPEKALLTVLCVRRLRPSNTVLRSVELLAQDLGISPGQVGRTAAKLEDRRLIRRRRVAGSRMLYDLLFFSPGLPGGVREAAADAASDQEAPPSLTTRPPMQGEKNPATRPPMQGEPVLVHEVGGGPVTASPAQALAGGEEEGKGEAGAPAPLVSMRLLTEHLADGRLLVRRRCSDGTAPAVWIGTAVEWTTWTPPDCLRDEAMRDQWPKVDP